MRITAVVVALSLRVPVCRRLVFTLIVARVLTRNLNFNQSKFDTTCIGPFFFFFFFFFFGVVESLFNEELRGKKKQKKQKNGCQTGTRRDR